MPDIVSGDDLMVLRAAVIEDLEGFLDAAVDTIGIEAVLGKQQLRIAMCHEAIWNTHAHDRDFVLQTVLFEQFQDRGSKASGEVSFFNRDDQTLRSRQGEQQSAVERFREPTVDNGGLDSFFRQMFSGLERWVDHRTVSDNRHFTAIAQQLGLTNLE